MEEDIKCKTCSNEPANRINVQRFLNKVDSCYSKNDLEEALRICKYWEESAKQVNDKKGLVSILNEEIGIYRRLNKKSEAIAVSEQIIDLLHDLELETAISSAIVFINAATNFSIFGENEKAEIFYKKAMDVFKRNNKINTYEYASLLNNYAVYLFNNGELDKSEKCYNEAIDILKKIGTHDSEIALSLLGLCHLYFDKGIDNVNIHTEEDVYALVENNLDLALKYLFSTNNKNDSHYAYDLSKALSSLQYFGRTKEYNKAKELSNKILKEK